MPDRFFHDPDAVLDYKFDWTSWLSTGETVTVEAITVPSGITLDSESITDAGLSVTGWISGGTAGQQYQVTCHITTNGSREDDRTITLVCRDK